MKARVLGNNLRFRLRQPEVSYFQQHGKVTEVIKFVPAPTDQVCFCLEASAGRQLTVSFKNNTITLGVPQQLAEEWTSTDRVGFHGKTDTGKGRVIEVLVEKDIACLDAPEEDNVGAYPNPNTACYRKMK